MSGATHTYTATCSWSGSTADGYEQYDRAHDATAPPTEVALRLSGDAAFHGDTKLLNPEQLVVLAAASCQLLSFLAVAARARIDVVGYEDAAVGVMPEDEQPMHITEIVLRPVITVRADVDDARLAHLCEVAHEHCFVANSLRTEVSIEPTFIHTV